MNQATKKTSLPVCVFCRNCGAPAGYDIIRQTYRCAYCGEDTGITEARHQLAGRRSLNKNAVQDVSAREILSCPNCGGKMIFPAGEGAAKCDYCGSKLVRAQLAGEQMPELIIPFFLTEEEAKNRLLEWAKKNSRRKEAKDIQENIGKTEGRYLLFNLVRGPVTGEVTRDKAERKYHCTGYIEGNAVNMNTGFDNAVLDAAEPFDWTQAKAFDFGYLAGQSVRLPDVSGEDAEKRILSEVENAFLPEVCRAMKTQATEVSVSAENLEIIPVLLPFYIIRAGKLFAAVNGQTGRVAVSSETTKKKRSAWFIEPIVYTLICTVAVGFATGFEIALMFPAFMIFFGAFFGLMYYSRLAPVRSVILRSQAAKARRERDELKIEEGRDILKNPYDNTPVFIERDKNGKQTPVKIKFYSFGRWLTILLKLIFFNFAPAIIAAGIRFLQIAGTGEPFLDKFYYMGGASWYVIASFVTLLYWTRGVRRDIYNHPVLYEILPTGKTRRFGGFLSRRLSLFHMFGSDVDKNGSLVSFKDSFSDTGCFTVGIVVAILVFLFFNTAAILM